ncbi:hypothetical protein DITRI_Ditri06bG0026400 [Diplodiscus trichospermus]
MRIRKRQVPLPFSSISPVPLSSDPNFNRSPVVQLPPQQPTPCFDPQCPSDPPNHPIGQRLPTQGSDSSAFPGKTTTHGEELRKKENYLVLNQGGGGEEERGGEGEKSNDTREKSVLGEELGNGSLPQLSSSHEAVGRWGEGEKAFPLKKRRGGLERRENDDDTIMAERDNKKVMIYSSKMKTKMNKKFVQQQNENEQEEKEDKLNASISSAKKRGRGGALMEGSRCSRVNGRGWRCCQQTLVGYSLCEHHLGKGRLRSMTSVRSRSLASSSNATKKEEKPSNDHQYQTPLSSYTSPSQQAKQTKRELLGESGDNGEEQKPLMTTKKRVKLGMVKARSISSLLGQNDNAIAVADHKN